MGQDLTQVNDKIQQLLVDAEFIINRCDVAVTGTFHIYSTNRNNNDKIAISVVYCKKDGVTFYYIYVFYNNKRIVDAHKCNTYDEIITIISTTLNKITSIKDEDTIS